MRISCLLSALQTASRSKMSKSERDQFKSLSVTHQYLLTTDTCDYIHISFKLTCFHWRWWNDITWDEFKMLTAVTNAGLAPSHIECPISSLPPCEPSTSTEAKLIWDQWKDISHWPELNLNQTKQHTGCQVEEKDTAGLLTKAAFPLLLWLMVKGMMLEGNQQRSWQYKCVWTIGH